MLHVENSRRAPVSRLAPGYTVYRRPDGGGGCARERRAGLGGAQLVAPDRATGLPAAALGEGTLALENSIPVMHCKLCMHVLYWNSVLYLYTVLV